MNIKENKLYTNFSQSFALSRFGANLLLNGSKAWTLDGTITDLVSPYAFINAYTIHDLMNINLKHGIDIPITGNSKNDIAFAVSKIMSEIMKKNRFPFRIWNGDSYVPPNSSDQLLIDCTGRLRLFRRNIIGVRQNVPKIVQEHEVPDHFEIEEFTGIFDAFKVPIFRNDSVLLEEKQFKVSKTLEWELTSNNCISIPLYEKRDLCVVLGSSRMETEILNKIASSIRLQ